jgi:hypothetical protein
MTSPDATISTRRFFCRPAGVELSAAGLDLPSPCAVTFASAKPKRSGEFNARILGFDCRAPALFVLTVSISA